MQLDLLKEQTPVSKKPKDSSASSKARSTSKDKQPPVLENKDIAVIEQPLPPLPESLRPPFAASERELEALDEDKAPGAFKTISEASKFLSVPQHVLRFWEGRFAQIKPLKLHGGRRYYRPEDIEILTTIKNLLYKQGYTIKGAKKAFSLHKQAEAAKPAEAKAPATAPHRIADRKKSQLTVLRQELISLRDTLALHIK